ncbi:MAG: inner rane protein translocase component YidC [Frankiales bacterium]|nr:inner rane protein translocase component YidC [Frankiales bacterium]
MNGLIASIATPVATVLRAIHALFSTFLAPSSGPAWGLSIVFLTICVRLLLFPLFVKQIKSQRRMQELAPKIKELQARHKGDRETLNTELMKLYKDNNANPISGCLPLILQLPVFFALFSVIREFKPGAHAKYGLSAHDLAEGGRASIFGAPISAALNSSASLVHKLGGSVPTVRVVAIVMIVLMGATTFWTQRQMMARAGTAVDKQQQQVQKFMLYVLPFSFAIFGFSFPIGVLLYWLTTNIWSMGQQAWVIKRMPPVVPGSSGPSGGGKGGPSGDRKGPGGGGPPGKPGKAKSVEPEPDGPAVSTGDGVLTATGATTSAVTGTGPARPPVARPAAKRAAGSRKNKKRGRR